MEITDDSRARFWAKVNKNGAMILDTPCWEWTANRPGGRYGHFWCEGKTHIAHRISWYLATGVEAGDAFVCHHCDNVACVNPTHLFLGTARSNMQDRNRKGRNVRGQRVNTAKLSPDEVVEIRRLHGLGLSQVDLANAFSVQPAAISKIILRVNWK